MVIYLSCLVELTIQEIDHNLILSACLGQSGVCLDRIAGGGGRNGVLFATD